MTGDAGPTVAPPVVSAGTHRAGRRGSPGEDVVSTAEPEAQAAEPEAQAAEPEAEAAEPEAQAAEPEAQAAEPEAEAAEPEAQAAEPEAQAAEPEAQAAEPEAEAAEPEAQAAEPEAQAAEPEAQAAEPEAEAGRGPVLRTSIVSSVTLDLPAQHPMVVLREAESPWRQLQFRVGLPDGTALACALRRIDTPRPLTHELLGDILAGFDIDVVAVRLVGRRQGTYFAELDLQGRTGRRVLSCRPSDALVVALRQAVPAPILVAEALFDGEGDVLP